MVAFSDPLSAGSQTAPRRKVLLNGKEYTLAVNNGPNNLHSGLDYYDARLWNAKEESENSCHLHTSERTGIRAIRETPSYPSPTR